MLSDEEKKGVAKLTKVEILGVLEHQGVNIARDSQRDKSTLLQIIWEQSDDVLRALHSASESKKLATRKRRNEHKQDQRQAKRQRIEDEENDKIRDLLTLPSEEEINQCYRAFLEATSNAALQMLVCVSCARELHHSDGQFQFLDTLQYSHRLIPKYPHPAHSTIESMLLVTEHITTIDGRARGWFCDGCLRSLESDRLPALALANRMWIGQIPPEIARLTVPEQILVSLYHPRCYIYKLHPRNMWGHNGDPSSLQNGLKGNVTTYELNMPDVVRMLEGKLMPRPTTILASTIAVSFIGLGYVPKNWLKQTFRVRRAVVLAAIRCLKEVTRHPGYADLEISDDELAKLPEDAVPDEILAAIRFEDDVGAAQREAESYVHNENTGTLSLYYSVGFSITCLIVQTRQISM
jgi:hypothetical protein